MATEIGKAYLQIMPSMKGISGAISKELDGTMSNAGHSAGLSLGSSMVAAISGAIAAAGLGKIVQESLMAGADLQQSFGGLDTIFAGAQDQAKAFAKEAYKAGISANTYAEQAVSMGASLKQALGGDSLKAIQMADKAILDMADNSAKMGTDIGIIQNTYQSLARGNYAMLDNLKLGFGGTKAEMERLLETAEALPAAMGRDFDISNYADVVEAIHIVQEDMGLAGVAAKEASETFSGSFAAMKASATNVFAGLALGEDIRPALEGLASTTSAFLFNNFFPMIQNIFKGLPTVIGFAISEAGPMILSQFQSMLAGMGVKIDFSAITSKFGKIGEAFQPVIESLQTAFGQLPGVFQTVADAVGPVIEHIIDTLGNLDFSGISDFISAILPAIEAGFSNMMAIVGPALESVVTAFQNLWNTAQPLISVLAEALMPAFEVFGSFLGGVFQGILIGVEAAFNTLKGVIEFLTPVVTFLVDVFKACEPALSVVAQWIGTVIGLFANMGSASEGLSAIIKSGWENIQNAISIAGGIIGGVIDFIKGLFSGAGTATDVLKNVFSAAWDGMKNAITVARDIIKGAIDTVKNAFQGFGDFVSSIGDSVKGVIKGIEGVFNDLTSIDISGAGRAIMDGFLNGLKSAWNSVTDFVGGIGDWIYRNKGPIEYDRKLLIPAGLAIMGGLHTSLVDGFEKVKSTVSGMAGILVDSFGTSSIAMDMVGTPEISSADLSSYSMNVGGQGMSVIDRLVRLENLLSALLDKELNVYLDGEKLAQNSYMRQGDIMAREGI